MFKEGDIIKFDYKHDGVNEYNHLFILVKCYEDDFIFQLVCIKGYHSGTIECYIRKEKGSVISRNHLIKELNLNFIEIDWNSFSTSIKIIEV